MYETTLDALRRGAAAEALAAAQELTAAQPQDPHAHRLLAAARRAGGDRDGALAALDQALAIAPEDANLHLERAGLLLDARELDQAQRALAQAIGLDPNQFPAYIVQAQLAISRGDLDEAERLVRTAARIAPDHPQVAAVEGTLLLRRGDADAALSLLSGAAERSPDEPQLRHALGFAYLAKGHYAFAEQAFRGLMERHPAQSASLRVLIVELMRRQGRTVEAADELTRLAASDDSPGLQRWLGEIELEAGRTDSALPRLRAALAAEPRDRRTLSALIEAWRRLGDADDARTTLEAALATHPQTDDLWRARLLFEPFAGDEARAVVERWMVAMPDYIPALEARATIHDQAGEREQADAIAHRIVELNPGDTRSELRIIDSLMRSDADAAVSRVESLLARAQDEQVKLTLRHLLGRTLDNAGQPGAAAATWMELQTEAAPSRLPLPPVTTPRTNWPDLAPLPEDPKGVLLLWGPPGSLVERIAQTFDMAQGPLRADRFGSNPPNDPLQRYGTAEALIDGSLDPAYAIRLWRAALPTRGIHDGAIFDWLLWWDNALLLALRPHLPEAVLMIALRDPRDMLLDWLAYGAPAPFKFESPEIAARWMAQVLNQIAALHEQDLMPHRLIKLDEISQSPGGIAQAIADALQITISAMPDEAIGPQRFEPGHWRAFAEPLAEAYALLTPVAKRLGYPES
ncbi:tetratricopeptide repeat protein [Lysobacter silvisoli]|uniref:Adenylate cyclase n=1 Tax=Lysobacter silvisoli TaxID=2293254 RepID=A0A371JYE4_9GAMM|nr:tetratricopeptide repeat protein [Lysobacter silvisoli]RDZ26689.1 adenylate cyclase [Lysobacter silvisoli]